MQIKIDHVTACGSDIKALQKEFAEFGLVTDYGGPHANGITHMALLGFEDGSYLELIAPINKERLEGSAWAELMLGDAGAGAWAIGTEDIQTEVARLKSLGIKTAGWEAGSRRRPDGKVIEWKTASAGPGTPGAILPFLIQDRTPREWRMQASASMKRSGLTGIAGVVLGVKNLEAATALFRRAYAWDEPWLEDHAEFGAEFGEKFGAKVVYFPGTPVMLASPLRQDSWLASRLTKFGEIPAAFLLGANNIEQASQRFHLTATQNWFGRTVAWFESEKFEPGKSHGISMGLVQD